jgi:hypothetical protein
MKVKKCKDCILFDKKRSVCNVTVIVEGETYELSVKKNDDCHWLKLQKENDDKIDKAIKDCKIPEIKKSLIEQSRIPLEVKGVRVWSDGKNGHIQEIGDF